MARIVTNRDGVSDLSYHLLQGPNGVRNQVITVGKQGDIAAGTVSGHAVVMVTESEEVFGLNQTLLVHVEVSLRRHLETLFQDLIFIISGLSCSQSLNYSSFISSSHAQF